MTSSDVLLHLSNEELSRVSRSSFNSDRMTRLLGHLLSQGSYYPVYPPDESQNVDSSSINKAYMKKYAPNILFVPSNFPPFIKRVGETLCINPGRTAKGKSGSFAHVVI